MTFCASEQLSGPEQGREQGAWKTNSRTTLTCVAIIFGRFRVVGRRSALCLVSETYWGENLVRGRSKAASRCGRNRGLHIKWLDNMGLSNQEKTSG